MKKWLLLLLLPGQLFATTITSQQVVLVSTTTQAILQSANQLATFAATVQPLIANSNVYNLYFSTNTTSLSAAQENDIYNYYEALKTQIQNAVNSLP